MKHLLAAVLVLSASSLFGAVENFISVPESRIVPEMEISRIDFASFSKMDEGQYPVYCIPETMPEDDMVVCGELYCYNNSSSSVSLNIFPMKKGLVRTVMTSVLTVNNFVFSIVKRHFSLVRTICFSSIRRVL